MLEGTARRGEDSGKGGRGLDTVFPAASLPPTLLGFTLRFSGWHQLLLAAMSVAVFLAETVPLELQRRIVNDAFKGGAWGAIVTLSLAYAGLAVAQGLLKLGMNIYRARVGEKAVRSLRLTVEQLARGAPPGGLGSDAAGIETSMTLAEADPIGSFVGVYLSEPMLQGGILLSVFGYMLYLQPKMALVALVVFTPQLVFVPLMQRAINKRVAVRIATLREISGGMIRETSAAAPEAVHAGQRLRIEDVFTLNMGIYKLKFSMNFLMNLMHHLGTAGVLAAGGWFVVKGQTEVGTVVAFLSGLSRVNDPWGDLVNWFRDLTVTATKFRLIAAAVRDIDAAQRGEG
jgi:ABC-type multidrug transport system fused ATPase/permease subunit